MAGTSGPPSPGVAFRSGMTLPARVLSEEDLIPGHIHALSTSVVLRSREKHSRLQRLAHSRAPVPAGAPSAALHSSPGSASIHLSALPAFPQGTFSLIIEALHTDSPDDLATGKQTLLPDLSCRPWKALWTLWAPTPTISAQRIQSVSSVAWPRRGT